MRYGTKIEASDATIGFCPGETGTDGDKTAVVHYTIDFQVHFYRKFYKNYVPCTPILYVSILYVSILICGA